MHFIDDKCGLSRVWDIEFESSDTGNETSSGLTSVDHIAQSTNDDEMCTRSQFYTSLFKLDKKPVVDVVNPGCIVRSQVIESPGSNFRLTLNGADIRRTRTGQFVAERFSSAVQHIAFVCQDIVETADQLRREGFDELVMPANYYDDLKARFGLSEAMKTRLLANNILYDEDADDIDYQLYSQPYGDRFFFEIVQRVNGYCGYGAANAPYRTAALKRSFQALASVA